MPKEKRKEKVMPILDTGMNVSPFSKCLTQVKKPK